MRCMSFCVCLGCCNVSLIITAKKCKILSNVGTPVVDRKLLCLSKANKMCHLFLQSNDYNSLKAFSKLPQRCSLEEAELVLRIYCKTHFTRATTKDKTVGGSRRKSEE